MKKIKVLTVQEYVSKKTGKQSWRCTGLSSEGEIVVFFRPAEEEPKRNDEYRTVLVYNSFDFGYKVTFERVEG